MAKKQDYNKQNKEKICPVCGSHDWKYDVISWDGLVFCGDCYDEVCDVGRIMGVYGFDWKHGNSKFLSVAGFNRAVKMVKRGR